MNQEPYNPDDLSYLLSRSMDEKLPHKEAARLTDELADSEALREEARQLRALNDLLKESGADAVHVDSPPFAQTVRASVEAENEQESLQQVDDWLARWGEPDVQVDCETFVGGVMERIAPPALARSARRMFFRIAAPLAMAAALYFAFTTTLESPTEHTAVCHVDIARCSEAGERVARNQERTTLVVMFARDQVADAYPLKQRSGIGFVAVGSTAVERSESPPL